MPILPAANSHFKPLSNVIPKSFARLQAMIDDPATHWRPENPRTCDNPECDGDGNVIRRATDGHETASLCPDCQRRWIAEGTDRVMRDWDGWATVPTFDEMRLRPNFIETESFTAMKRMADRIIAKPDEPYAYMLTGGHGRSKTYSAMILLKAARNAGIPTMPIKFPKIISALKRGLDGATEVDAVFFAMQKNTLIIIDEIGSDLLPSTLPHLQNAITEIFDLCYNRRFLVMIGNRGWPELKDALPSGVASRIGSDYCRLVEEPFSPDLRHKNKNSPVNQF